MVDADAPPFDPSERVLEISAASLESRVKVAEDLARDGPVMGHRGETLRSIIQSSKAQVQQHKAEHLEVVRQVHSALEQRGREGSALMDLGVGLAGIWLPALPSHLTRTVQQVPVASPVASLAWAQAVGVLASDSAFPATWGRAFVGERLLRYCAARWRGRPAVDIPSETRDESVAGTAVANSVACYLIQDRIFMMH
ncbi:unnamed protein product [Effrenium voratum]|nr:unnamed protein product [Effrenium voratum]